MKHTLITRLLVLCTLFAFCLSCKKDNPQNANAQLVGSWTETPQDGQFLRTFFFGADGSFTLHSAYMNTTPSSLALNGTYTIKGDKLAINITEEYAKTQGFPPTTTKVDHTFLDEARFSISGNKLTINYVGYPADAPVAGVLKLVKN